MLATFDGNTFINRVLVESDNRDAGRSVAAIRRVYDFSSLSGSAFEKASRQRLLSGARVTPSKNQIGIELGHFVVTDIEGNKDFACNVFENVELVFMGLGMATSGQRPKLTVKGPCRYGNDVNQISAISVPFQKIRTEDPGELELTYAEFPDYSFVTEDIFDSWPSEWELYEIHLSSKMPGRQVISVGHSEIRSWYSGPLAIAWPTETEAKLESSAQSQQPSQAKSL